MKIHLPIKFLKLISCLLLFVVTSVGFGQTEVRLPDGDVSIGTWTPDPLWSKINGIGGAVINTPNTNNAANTTGEVTIQDPTNAGIYTGVTVRFDARKNGNGGSQRGLEANIRVNGMLQTAEVVTSALGGTLQTYTVSWTNLNYTQTEMNTLQIVFTSTGNTGAQGNRRFVEIDYLESTLTYCVTPAPPTAVTATNSTICVGSSSNLNATSTGNEIQWYTVPTEGTALITTLSGVNYSVSPTVTTTYYAEALAGGRCVSATRTPVTVTVNSLSLAGTVSANQAICSGAQPDDIILTGSNGSIQWQSSPDNITFTNISGATSSILSGATIGALASTTYFRAVVTSGICTPVTSATVTVAIESTTWNGTTWSNGDPTATKAVIFTGDYNSAASFEACSIVVNNNANVMIGAGTDVTLRGAITVNAGSTFTLESNANLIQQTDAANAGAITVNRNTSSEVKRLDYNLWSSPVGGQNLLAFSPETLTNRFYVYNPTSNLYSTVPPATTDFAAGTGYLIRMPNTFSVDTPGIWEGTFTGVPNNGTYTITVGNDTFNAIGNPYPSTVDLDAFLADNPTDGTVYFWRKTNNALSTSYATYTTAGGVANSGGGSAIEPNGTLQVGQGFLVKSTGTTFTFTNAMRIADHGNQFLRTAVENNEITTEPASQKSRLWLNLTSNVGVAGQLLVGYVPNATQGIDAGIDGRYINDSPNALTSIINGEEFVIQGRSLPFTAADVVPLGFKTTVAGAYTIALNQVDGLFTDETLPIIIKDNVTGTEHNLRNGAYEFTAVSGVFNGRFELKYQSTLSVANPIAASTALIYKQDQVLQVKVTDATVTSVTVYDLTGRVIAALTNVSSSEVSLPLGQLNTQVLLVRVQTPNGDLIRKVLW